MIWVSVLIQVDDDLLALKSGDNTPHGDHGGQHTIGTNTLETMVCDKLHSQCRCDIPSIPSLRGIL